MKTVIEMARSVGARPQQNKNCDVEYLMSVEALERFAALVRADEREKWMERTAILIRGEREACATVCERMWHTWLDSPEENEPNKPDAEDCYRAIRARSNT